MDGTWLFKLDNAPERPRSSSPGIAGWKQVTVPNAWNVGDDTPQSFLGGVGWYRKDFTLPTRRQARVVGGALRVGQLPLEGLAQRQADRQEPRRLPAVRVPPAGRAAQARRRQPAGHPGRLRAASTTDFPPSGLSTVRRADRRLVELRRPAARGLPAQDRRRRLQHGRRPARPAVRHLRRRRSPTASTLRNYGPSARRVARQRALRRARARHRHARRSAPSASRRSPSRSRSTSRACGRRPARTSTTRRLAVRSGGSLLSALHAAGPASARSRSSAATCSSTARRMNFRGVGAARGLARRGLRDRQRDRATSSSRGSRSSARPSSARTTRWRPTRRSAPTSSGSCSWSEIPVYSVKTQYLKQKLVRAARGARARARTSRPTATTRR